MQQSPINQTLKIELEKLPSMPHSLLQLLEAMGDPDIDFDQISDLIQTDPALTIRVMSIANSAANYRTTQYRHLNHLIVTLGLRTVKTIVINSAVQQFFSQFNIDDKGLLARFWQTSLLTAGIAKALAHIIGSNNEDEAYIAGLLHKSGELVCFLHNADSYNQKTNEQLSNSKNKSFYELLSQQTLLENDFIGASVPEIGTLIVNGIDHHSLLGDAILYQRESAEEIMGAPHLIQVVNLAQKLALAFFSESSPEKKVSEAQLSEYKNTIFHEASRLFDLNQPLIEDMLKKCYTCFLSSAKSMGININDNKIEPDHQKAQIELAENVRSIALSSSLQQINTERLANRPEKELIIQIMQQLNVLFNLPNSLYLAFDEESKQLKGQYGSNNLAEHLLSQFIIPLTASATLPVRSLLKKKPVSSQDNSSDKSSVLDRQLLRLLNTEALLCIPLIDSANKKNYGVLVAGVSSLRLQKIQREKGLLHEFSKASSELISNDRNIAEQVQSAIEEEKALQSLEIRKLVHEANNPLGIMRNYLQILSLKMADSQDAKLQGQLEILMDEVERVGQIILRIRDTPEQSDISNTQVNLNELVQKLVSIFEQSLFVKAGIVANISFDKSIPLLKTNTNSLKQILTNLLKNATEAMPDGGEIDISTRDQVNYNGKQFVELSIRDTGSGISDTILKNLFNPVKSTKSGEHSGLGLSIIKNLVNDLGGTISGRNLYTKKLSSESNQQAISGAEFLILLPRIFNE